MHVKNALIFSYFLLIQKEKIFFSFSSTSKEVMGQMNLKKQNQKDDLEILFDGFNKP